MSHDPLAIALPYTELMVRQGYSKQAIPDSREDALILAVNSMAEGQSLLGRRYVVETEDSLLVPFDHEMNSDYLGYNFPKLQFSGELVNYTTLRARSLGETAALCMTFDGVMFLPGKESVEDSMILYVPVLAVNEIDQVVA